jgi:hypothetical protein
MSSAAAHRTRCASFLRRIQRGEGERALAGWMKAPAVYRGEAYDQ